MKNVKAISASLALALLLTACGGNAAAPAALQGGEDSAAASQSKATEPAPEPAPAADGGLVYGAALEEEQTIYDENGLTITTAGLEKTDFYVEIYFTVKNNTDLSDLYIDKPGNYAGFMGYAGWYESINGYGLNSSNCGQLAWRDVGPSGMNALHAGETGVLVWSVPCETLEDFGITEITDVRIDLVWGGAQSTILENGSELSSRIIPIELKADAAGETQTPENPGAVVYEKDGITVSVSDIKFQGRSSNGSKQEFLRGSVDIWIRNETGKYIATYFATDKILTVNGKDVAGWYGLDYDNEWTKFLWNRNLCYDMRDIRHVDIPGACTKEGIIFPVLPSSLSEEFSEEERQYAEKWAPVCVTVDDLADNNTLTFSLELSVSDTPVFALESDEKVIIEDISLEFSGADARAALDAAE